MQGHQRASRIVPQEPVNPYYARITTLSVLLYMDVRSTLSAYQINDDAWALKPRYVSSGVKGTRPEVQANSKD